MGAAVSVSDDEARFLGMKRQILNASIHMHVLTLVKSSGGLSCDSCSNGSEYFYECSECGLGSWDLCMNCYSNICQQQQHLTAEDEMRCQQLLSNPTERARVIDAISQSFPEMSPDDQRIANICLEILKSGKVDGRTLGVAVKTVLVDEVKDEVKQSVLTEMGLQNIDPTGITSALNLIKSVAKGDVKGVATSAGGLILGKLLLAAVGCTVS